MIKITNPTSIKNYCGTYRIRSDWTHPRNYKSEPHGHIVSDEYHYLANVGNPVQKKSITEFSAPNSDAILFELINIKFQSESDSEIMEKIVHFCNKYGLLDSSCLRLDEKIKNEPKVTYAVLNSTASQTIDEKLANYKDHMAVDRFLDIQDYLEHMMRLMYFLSEDTFKNISMESCDSGKVHSAALQGSEKRERRRQRMGLQDGCDFLNTIFYFLFRNRGKLNLKTTPTQELVRHIRVLDVPVADSLREMLDDHRAILPKASLEHDFSQVVNMKLPQYQEDFFALLDWLDRNGLLDKDHLQCPASNASAFSEESEVLRDPYQQYDRYFFHHIAFSETDLMIIKKVARNILCEELNKELEAARFRVTCEMATFSSTLYGANLYMLLIMELRSLVTSNAQILRCERTDCMCYFSNVNKKRKKLCYCSDRCRTCQVHREKRDKQKELKQ